MDDDAFRHQFPDLSLIDPVALLRELESPESVPGQETGAGEGQGG